MHMRRTLSRPLCRLCGTPWFHGLDQPLFVTPRYSHAWYNVINYINLRSYVNVKVHVKHVGIVSNQLQAQAVVSTEKKNRYPLHRKLGGPHSQSGRFWRSEKYLVPAGNYIPDHSACSLVTTPTTIFRLN